MTEETTRVEELTVVGLALSVVGMGLSSQGGIDTTAGIGGLALMGGAVVVLLYAVVKSD
ncbi:hypothetical protein ABNG03_01260 [Halorubrum sp. RMP-47]|uniref:Transporter n=1 Tax=Halorubrum miltondacostae TaxID=3076378 RepID=A0ABD5LYH0_9EURY